MGPFPAITSFSAHNNRILAYSFSFTPGATPLLSSSPRLGYSRDVPEIFRLFKELEYLWNKAEV
jgi:hypothetical protein